MKSIKLFARSDHPVARYARAVYRWLSGLTLPAPRAIVVPMLWAYCAYRAVYYFVLRVAVCEPLFKAACTRYGANLHTDVYVHWVNGVGDLILGDDVLVDGKCSFVFAGRFTGGRAALVIGDRTAIGHESRFVVGKRISIGNDCRISPGVYIFDSNGHSADPESRLLGLPPKAEEVRPVTIGNNVWLGARCIIFPGVTIGDGSVVSAGSVVLSDVPANTVVAGNPARRIGSLEAASSRRPTDKGEIERLRDSDGATAVAAETVSR